MSLPEVFRPTNLNTPLHEFMSTASKAFRPPKQKRFQSQRQLFQNDEAVDLSQAKTAKAITLPKQQQEQQP